MKAKERVKEGRSKAAMIALGVGQMLAGACSFLLLGFLRGPAHNGRAVSLPRPNPEPSRPRRSAIRVGVRRSVDWRVARIVSIIAAGRYPNCQTLAREIEVSPKTIQRDLSHMMNQRDFPLEYDDRRHGYHFTRPVSEFAPMQLSLGELVALFVAQKAMEPLRGTKMHRLVGEGVRKIVAACPEAAEVKWSDIEAAFSMKTSGSLKSDVTIFTKLVNAVTNRRELAFQYHSLKGRTRELRRVQPYHVEQANNGWYLKARDLKHGEIRTFALQRMTDVEVLAKRFQRDPTFDPAAHNGTGFGVWSYSADSQPFEIRIRFTGWAARVVPERNWHPTQEITTLKRDGSEIEFRARLCGIEEITRWVLSHGRHARVLGPKKLVEAVLAEARAMLE